MSGQNEPKRSPVEHFKEGSRYLRGEIPGELVDGNPFFGKSSIQLLKHHGAYQQDNRDERPAARAKGLPGGKAFSMMLRVRTPGGRLTSDQMLTQLDLCDQFGDGTLRLTTRQTVQFHGVLKSDLKNTIARINEIQLSTLAACGDVVRNVMCCPAPHHQDPVHQQMQALVDQLVEAFEPRTSAYHEIWLTDEETGDKQLVAGGTSSSDVEPLYGPTYLPRKFKIAVGLPGDNCVDLYSQDLGLMAICEDFRIIGYNVLVGGGFGVTPSVKKTFPAVAKRMAFVTPDQVIDVCAAVIKVQRDFGNRADRKTARLKYLIADWGLERFKAKVEEYYGHVLPDPHEDDVFEFDDHLGWREQGDGRWFYGLNVENGRVADFENRRIKSMLREICETLRPGIRVTAHQSLLFTDIKPNDRQRLERIIRSHGSPLSEEISTVRRWSMACVAMPTCGLAITESERALPGVIDQFEVELARLGLSHEKFTVRMTGCPNGCARPYNADIGLVGKAVGKYTILLGGRRLGDRLNHIYRDMVPAEDIVPTLKPVFLNFKQNRLPDETFGDFCHRQGVDALRDWSENYLAPARAG